MLQMKVPSVTHSLWIPDERLPLAAGTTMTMVVHPDGTEVTVTTAGGASL